MSGSGAVARGRTADRGARSRQAAMIFCMVICLGASASLQKMPRAFASVQQMPRAFAATSCPYGLQVFELCSHFGALSVALPLKSER